MNSAFAVLCVCLLAAQAQAAGPQISVGTCPEDVKVVANFDAARYMGHWYELESYWQIWELGGKCSSANYSLTEEGTVIVKNSMKTIVGIQATQEGTAVLTSTNGDARLEVTFDVPVVGLRTANYLVVDTDYDNYSVVYSCANLFGKLKYESAWILSRQKTLGADYSAKVDQVIANSNLLRRENFNIMNQEDC